MGRMNPTNRLRIPFNACCRNMLSARCLHAQQHRRKDHLARAGRNVRAPERTLLKQFKRFVGLPPLAYLRRLRLNLARSALSQAGCETAIRRSP